MPTVSDDRSLAAVLRARHGIVHEHPFSSHNTYVCNDAFLSASLRGDSLSLSVVNSPRTGRTPLPASPLTAHNNPRPAGVHKSLRKKRQRAEDQREVRSPPKGCVSARDRPPKNRAATEIRRRAAITAERLNVYTNSGSKD